MAAASRRSAGTHASQLDIGEDVVAPYLWDRGIRRVDVWRSRTRTRITSAACRR